MLGVLVHRHVRPAHWTQAEVVRPPDHHLIERADAILDIGVEPLAGRGLPDPTSNSSDRGLGRFHAHLLTHLRLVGRHPRIAQGCFLLCDECDGVVAVHFFHFSFHGRRMRQSAGPAAFVYTRKKCKRPQTPARSLDRGVVCFGAIALRPIVSLDQRFRIFGCFFGGLAKVRSRSDASFVALGSSFVKDNTAQEQRHPTNMVSCGRHKKPAASPFQKKPPNRVADLCQVGSPGLGGFTICARRIRASGKAALRIGDSAMPPCYGITISSSWQRTSSTP